MRTDKYNRMLAGFTGHHGQKTIEHVLRTIPAELKSRLTGAELGLVMSAVSEAYHEGKASLGGIDLCDDALWIPGDEKDSGQLVPLLALKRIKKEDAAPPQNCYSKGTKYTLEYVEGHS